MQKSLQEKMSSLSSPGTVDWARASLMDSTETFGRYASWPQFRLGVANHPEMCLIERIHKG